MISQGFENIFFSLALEHRSSGTKMTKGVMNYWLGFTLYNFCLKNGIFQRFVTSVGTRDRHWCD